MSDQPQSTARYFSQLRQTHSGQTVGWQECCNGHVDIYKAVACHDTLKLALADPERDQDGLSLMLRMIDNALPGSTIELRVVKKTVTTEIMEPPVSCPIHKAKT